MKLGHVFHTITDHLSKSCISNARLEARVLICTVLGISPEVILTYPGRDVTAENIQCIRMLADRRIAGEPMARILGRCEFWSIDFAIGPDTLIPRSDTETLIEATLGLNLPQAPRILDLGTGCGCILLTLLSEFPQATGIGLDISPGALKIARNNARALNLDKQSIFIKADFNAAPKGPFDLVISNPPYIATNDIKMLDIAVRHYDPYLALDGGADGLDVYRILTHLLPLRLAPGGYGVFEIGAGQASTVSRLFEEAGLHVLSLRRDLAGIERCIVII